MSTHTIKLLIPIQSISDLITNSSSEVFVSQANDELFKILKDLKITYMYFETEKSLKEYIQNNPWEFDEIVNINPYNNYMLMDELETIKNKDEIWEFFKNLYLPLLGKIIVDVDRDYLYQKQQEHNINIWNYIKR